MYATLTCHRPATAWSTKWMGTGVYSFCMCPGGIIAPCATLPDEVVTNGWSPSKRNNPYANSGIVVRYPGPFEKEDPLAGMEFQRDGTHSMDRWWEEAKRPGTAYWTISSWAGIAPTFRVVAIPRGSSPATSDQLCLPEIAIRLRTGLKEFGTKMRGYRTNEAVVVAMESRTSPVRIPRRPQRPWSMWK